jgi:type III restriction enzyme
MTDGKIDHLIINSPYEEPQLFWKRDERTGEFAKESGRRPAGYVAASPEAQSAEELGRFIPIELVGQIRPRVKKWRKKVIRVSRA